MELLKPNKNSTVKEILEYIVEPTSIDDRVKRYNETRVDYPWVHEMISSWFDKDKEFSLLTTLGTESTFKYLKYYSCISAQQFWIRNLPRFEDANTIMLADRKWSQLLATFDYMDKSDVDFFWGYMNGIWKGPRRINKVFFSKVSDKVHVQSK